MDKKKVGTIDEALFVGIDIHKVRWSVSKEEVAA